MDKRYWTPDDYDEVIFKLKKHTAPDERLPMFDDPATRLIVEKLTDHQNYAVVLDDQQLGLKHRNEVAVEFFNEWQDLNSLYRVTDRRDKYVYDKELIASLTFGLGLQLRYFALGNDKIKESADDPNAKSVRETIKSNVKALVKNYQLYLDEINFEEAFSEKGKILFSQGIDEYFTRLIKLHPQANYSEMKRKIQLMEKKTKSAAIKVSLAKILALIETQAKAG